MKRTVRLGLEQVTGMDGDGRMIGNKNIDIVEILEIPIGKGIEGVYSPACGRDPPPRFFSLLVLLYYYYYYYYYYLLLLSV